MIQQEYLQEFYQFLPNKAQFYFRQDFQTILAKGYNIPDENSTLMVLL